MEKIPIKILVAGNRLLGIAIPKEFEDRVEIEVEEATPVDMLLGLLGSFMDYDENCDCAFCRARKEARKIDKEKLSDPNSRESARLKEILEKVSHEEPK